MFRWVVIKGNKNQHPLPAKDRSLITRGRKSTQRDTRVAGNKKGKQSCVKEATWITVNPHHLRKNPPLVVSGRPPNPTQVFSSK